MKKVASYKVVNLALSRWAVERTGVSSKYAELLPIRYDNLAAAEAVADALRDAAQYEI